MNMGLCVVVGPSLTRLIGVSPSGKAQDFDSCIRWFKSIHPSHKKAVTAIF